MSRHESTTYSGERTQLLTINEVAAMLAVHRDTVYNLVRRGHLHPVRVGARLRFRVADVEQYIDGGSQ